MLKFNGTIKTRKNWKGSLDQYLKIGDGVDEAFVDYFIDVLPPATFRSTLVQIGEPYSHINGQATYATLVKLDGQWVYAGNCFKNSYENVDD